MKIRRCCWTLALARSLEQLQTPAAAETPAAAAETPAADAAAAEQQMAEQAKAAEDQAAADAKVFHALIYSRGLSY